MSTDTVPSWVQWHMVLPHHWARFWGSAGNRVDYWSQNRYCSQLGSVAYPGFLPFVFFYNSVGDCIHGVIIRFKDFTKENAKTPKNQKRQNSLLSLFRND